jgi:hypothetical protein
LRREGVPGKSWASVLEANHYFFDRFRTLGGWALRHAEGQTHCVSKSTVSFRRISVKKLFLLAVALVGAAAISIASPVQCGAVATFSGGNGGPINETCGAIAAGPGSQITSVTLTFFADFQFATGPANPESVTVSFTPDIPAGITNWTPATVPLVVTGPPGSPQVPSSSFSVVAGAANGNGTPLIFIPSFLVHITSATGPGSIIATSSGSVLIDYTTAPTGVPEPSTSAVAGVALLGIGLAGRRFGSSRKTQR